MISDNRESRVRIDLTAVVIAVRDGAPHVLTVERPSAPLAALPAGPLQSEHRTLQAGLRAWVEAQTGCRLGYVEQLYTFADRAAPQGHTSPALPDRAVSIAYLALVPADTSHRPLQGRWRNWYDFFPWEDRRNGEPPALDNVRQTLCAWADTLPRPARTEAMERIGLTFGLPTETDADGAGQTRFRMDEERALERYELLYEAGLVPETFADRGLPPTPEASDAPGLPMMADHRRILATGVSRLRAKIKYRPVLFELMAPTFTLSELQQTAEALIGISLHKQNFRRLIASQGLVEETGALSTETGGRPAKLMRFRGSVTLERPAPGVRVSATRRGAFP